MMRIILTLLVALMLLPTFGCKSVSLLPSSYDETVSKHDSYESLKNSYDNIVIGSSTKGDLKQVGFDLDFGNNVEELTYVAVSKIFLHNPAIDRSDLPEGIIECLEAKGGCKAYKISIENINKERYGSFWADVFNFRKRTRHTGWRFEALFILVNDKVVYALQSGQHNIDKTEVKKNPLGPVQGFGGEKLIDMAL